MYNSENVHSPERDTEEKRFAELIMSEAERVKPMIREQLLREYILGMGDTTDVFNTYCRTFGENKDRPVRMIIMKPSGANDFEDYFFIKNTTVQYIGADNVLFCAIINDFIVVLMNAKEKNELVELLDKIRATVKRCYGYNVLAIYSEEDNLERAPDLYERLKLCIGYSFYSDCNRTLYENEIQINSGDISLRPEYGLIENAVRSGDGDKIKLLVSCFFKKILKAMPAPAVAKTYCLELYVCIMRCCSVDRIDSYMRGISSVQNAKTILEIQNFIEEKAVEITAFNAPSAQKIYSSLVRDTISIINDNIENENLSLRWLAGTILYTNVDYLGKLFKKETGKNFSHYVMEKRMEMAKDLLYEGKMDRIYEIAENVGYGSNSQYFSQVFKKYTGVSPLEYKEFARLSRAKRVDETTLKIAQI